MTDWDARFRAGEYPEDPEPSSILTRLLSQLRSGRALDVATGTGRNALALAEAGFAVEALDRSRVGLEVAQTRARERGVDDHIDWLHADAFGHCYPPERYDLVTISFFRCVDRLDDIKRSLSPGGYLFIEHHLRSSETDREGSYRFGANELLRQALDLTVVFYDEGIDRTDNDRSRPIARLLARRSSGEVQANLDQLAARRRE